MIIINTFLSVILMMASTTGQARAGDAKEGRNDRGKSVDPLLRKERAKAGLRIVKDDKQIRFFDEYGSEVKSIALGLTKMLKPVFTAAGTTRYVGTTREVSGKVLGRYAVMEIEERKSKLSKGRVAAKRTRVLRLIDQDGVLLWEKPKRVLASWVVSSDPERILMVEVLVPNDKSNFGLREGGFDSFPHFPIVYDAQGSELFSMGVYASLWDAQLSTNGRYGRITYMGKSENENIEPWSEEWDMGGGHVFFAVDQRRMHEWTKRGVGGYPSVNNDGVCLISTTDYEKIIYEFKF